MAERSFLTGFMQGFGDQMIKRQDEQRKKEEGRELKELQIKALKSQINAEDAAAAFKQGQRGAQSTLVGRLTGSPAEEGFETVLPQGEGAPVAPQSLTDILSSDLGLFLKGGGSIQALSKIQSQGKLDELRDKLLSSGGGDSSGFTLDPFSMLGGSPKGVKSDLREVTLPDGSKAFQRISPSGEVSPVGGQSAPSPLDLPLTPSQLMTFRDERGRAPAPGTTMRQAGEAGFEARGKPTEGEKKLKSFATRANRSLKAANKALKDLGEPGLLSGPGGIAEKFPRFLQVEARQRLESSGREWITSILRPESGAVIGPEEQAGYMDTYFPEFGETDQAVIDLKEKMRMGVTRESIEQGGLTIDQLNRAAAGQEFLPEGIPPGSTLIGVDEKTGNAIYKTPEGKQLEVF